MDNLKKLLLVYPNQRWQKDDMNTVWDLNPATLCLLAAMVEDIISVKIIDAQFYNMTQNEFFKEVKEYAPDYVGISIMTSEYMDTLDITASLIKSINRNIVVIAGGVHVTVHYDYVIKNIDIDYAVRGEGEYVLRELIQYLNGERELPKCGLVFRKENQVITQEQSRVEDISKLLWPAYQYVDLGAYLNKISRFGPNRPIALPCIRMISTRGCPFGCSFCQVELISGKMVRSRDPQDVVDELVFLKEKYGIKSIIFEDDNLLTAKNSYAKRLFSLMIKRKLNLKWTGIAFAIFLLSDEILDLMKESGCAGIDVAVESGNERVLREIIGKPIYDLTKIPEIISKIRSRGMYCIANFIIGFPGEKWSEIQDTIDFAEHCGADYVKFFIAVVLHGTKLYKMTVENNALICDDEYLKIDWRYSQIRSDEWSPRDISILRAYEWDRINFSKNKIRRTSQIWGMNINELNNMRKRTRDALVFFERK